MVVHFSTPSGYETGGDILLGLLAVDELDFDDISNDFPVPLGSQKGWT